MLAYAVRMILIENKMPAEKDELWAAFYECVFDPLFYRFPLKERVSQPKSKTKTTVIDELVGEDFSSATAHEVTTDGVPCPELGATDDALLQFMYQFAKGAAEREVLIALRSRRLYHRIAVLSGEDPLEIYRQRDKDKERDEEQRLHKDIYDQFRNYRLDGDLEKIEKLRRVWETNLIKKLHAKLPSDSPESSRLMMEELEGVQPLILVDIPIKSTRRGGGGSDGLRYLTEESANVHSAQFASPVPRFGTWRVALDDEQLDKRVDKIRIFAHPGYSDFIVDHLGRSEIISALRS